MENVLEIYGCCVGLRVRAKAFWVRHHCHSGKIAVIVKAEVKGNSFEESVKACGIGTDQDIWVTVQYANGSQVTDRWNVFEVAEE
jgi:hypothetical protein